MRIALLLCIWQMPGQNLGQNPVIRTVVFIYIYINISHSLHREVGRVTEIELCLKASTSLPIYYSFNHPTYRVHVLWAMNCQCIESCPLTATAFHSVSTIKRVEKMSELALVLNVIRRENCVRRGEGGKAHATRCSQVITHPSTIRAQRCLTTVIGREPVFSTWCVRWQAQT